VSRAPAFPPLIPKPLAVAPRRGAFQLGRSARIVVRADDPEAARVARLLAARLRPATGYRLPVSVSREPGSGRSPNDSPPSVC